MWKIILCIFWQYYLKYIIIQWLLMHRTGMCKITWKSVYFVVFSWYYSKNIRIQWNFSHDKENRNLSEKKFVLRCFQEYYKKNMRTAVWKIKLKWTKFVVFSGILFEKTNSFNAYNRNVKNHFILLCFRDYYSKNIRIY